MDVKTLVAYWLTRGGNGPPAACSLPVIAFRVFLALLSEERLRHGEEADLRRTHEFVARRAFELAEAFLTVAGDRMKNANLPDQGEE